VEPADGGLNDMTTVLFNITHGFQARMLLRSSISRTLLERGVLLVVVSHSSDEEYFRKEFAHPRIILEPMPTRMSSIETKLVSLRQYLLMNPALGATLNHKNERLRCQSPRSYWFARLGNCVLGHCAPLRRAYMSMEAWLYDGKEFDPVLARHRPDLVVTGTPGYFPDDVHLLRACGRLGIPSACVMLSWDNLTSKGYMGAQPDWLLVWSDLMADEAVKYHNYPRNRMLWTGAAQFDHYFHLRDHLDRRAWRRAHAVPEDATMMVYGTINPAILPHEGNILRSIVGAMKAGKFRRRTHLWIRLHPQVVKGVYSKNLGPFEDLAGPDVTVEKPPVQSDKLAWDLPKEDATHLAELLGAADVVATPSSTLVIDAACAGTPIVDVLFDGDGPFEPRVRVARLAKYTHYAQILTTGGIAIARSIEEFVRLVEAYAEDPKRDEARRQEMIRQQLGCLDGQAGARTAEAILKLAGGWGTGNT
jgi:hypothetical protein